MTVPRIARAVSVQLAAVAVSVSANQVLSGGRWDVPWLAGTMVLAVAAGGLNQWLETRDGQGHSGPPGPVLRPGLAGGDGIPLLIGDVSLRDLGVHASRFGAEGDGPYVGRAADALLADALTGDEKRLVIVEGPRLAGSTRTLAGAARACLPGHLAAGFFDDPQVPLADMIGQAARWAAAAEAAGAMVWLDGLTPDRFTQLARYPLGSLPSGVLVLATLDSGQLDGMRIAESLTTLPDQYVLRVRLGVITGQERRALLAEDTYTPLRPLLEEERDLLMGRVMVAWGPLRAALALGGSEQATDRVALLRAVTDWYRAGIPRLLSPEIVRYLYQGYRRELGGAASGSPVSVTGLDDALRWATAPPDAGHPRLIDLQEMPGGRRYAPHPLLAVIADDAADDAHWPVSGVLWSYADRFFAATLRRDIGYTALTGGAYHAAARLLSHDDATVDLGAYIQIAVQFYRHSEWADSRHWYEQVIATGHPDQAPRAMYNLGVLEWEQGNPGRARHWYEQAIATGHLDIAPRAMVNLGNLEREQGNPGRARHWYEQAIATGHPDQVSGAMVNLGNLERDQGKPGRARHWYEQAIATGHPDQAPGAMVNLGNLERDQGNPARARHWYEQAVTTGHPDQAPGAMVGLGFLDGKQGNPGGARHWWGEVIATGHPDMAPRAMFNLGNLEREQGNPGGARHWWEEVIATGPPDEAAGAMYNLGNLEREQGNPARAYHWYEQAVTTGHPDMAPRAMVGLGFMERAQGNLSQARHWYEQALATGHPDMASLAQQEVRALDRHEGDRQRGEHFGRYGYLAYADPTLMKRDNHSPNSVTDQSGSRPEPDQGVINDGD